MAASSDSGGQFRHSSGGASEVCFISVLHVRLHLPVQMHAALCHREQLISWLMDQYLINVLLSVSL